MLEALLLVGALSTGQFVPQMAPVCIGQTDPVIVGTKAVRAHWQHDGLDIEGQPENLAFFNVAVTTSTMDLNQGHPALKTTQISHGTAGTGMAAGNYAMPLEDLLSGLGNGAYLVWVQAEDAAQNQSTWVSVPIILERGVPKPVMNLFIEIIIQINGGG